MIDMRSYSIILICLFISSKGLSQQFDTKSLLLNECKIADTAFLDGISTLVLSDSAYFKDKKNYAFHLSFDSSKSVFNSNYVAILMPIMESSIAKNQGVFLIENIFFLIDSSIPLDIYTLSGKKIKIFYKKTRTPYNKDYRLMTVYTEEFSIWYLNYSDGIMSVKNKLFVY